MPQAPENFASPPAVARLPQTWNGRRVVRKRLPDDCLLDGQLHPGVRQRLSRVRELASRSVACLLSVERDDGGVVLLWEWIDGRSFVDVATDRSLPAHALSRLMRELILAVESLHALGIVHGNLHGRNVIVDPRGMIRLTDLSPMLHTDEKRDLDAVAVLLRGVIEARDEQGTTLGQSVFNATLPDASMRSLATRLMSVSDANAPALPDEPHLDAAPGRSRSLLAAALLAIAALAFAVAVHRLIKSREPGPLNPPLAPEQP